MKTILISICLILLGCQEKESKRVSKTDSLLKTLVKSDNDSGLKNSKYKWRTIEEIQRSGGKIEIGAEIDVLGEDGQNTCVGGYGKNERGEFIITNRVAMDATGADTVYLTPQTKKFLYTTTVEWRE